MAPEDVATEKGRTEWVAPDEVVVVRPEGVAPEGGTEGIALEEVVDDEHTPAGKRSGY